MPQENPPWNENTIPVILGFVDGFVWIAGNLSFRVATVVQIFPSFEPDKEIRALEATKNKNIENDYVITCRRHFETRAPLCKGDLIIIFKNLDSKPEQNLNVEKLSAV
jgi:hypothetical protein